MTDEDNHYLVTLPLEIRSIMSSIARHNTLVRLDIPGRAVSLISTILQIDDKANRLVMDNASEAGVNSQLLHSTSVRFQAMLHRILIEFEGKLTPTTHQGKPALAMPMPAALQRLQRREHFRVDVPSVNPATCTLRHPMAPRGEISLPLRDISAGGLQIIDNDKYLDATPGTVYDQCTLNLPEAGEIVVRLKVVHSLKLIQENGKILHAIACSYVDLQNRHEIIIQSYIGMLERAIMARRWGNN
ncbi:MAG: flagellar brake protein [Alcaligenaceae bacterium]|nr:flagellar brake protein [Alcaligenaceae bacterium]